MKHTKTKKKRTVKVWAVTWTEESREMYGDMDGFDKIITVEPRKAIKVNISENSKGRPKIRYTDASAIFGSIPEAEAYRRGNVDWVVVPCIISYEI